MAGSKRVGTRLAPRVANARMYSVSPEVDALWRALLTAVAAQAGVPLTLIEHDPPALMAPLWERPDKGAVFMCGLPFSRAVPQPVLVAAPVPAGVEYAGQPRYWSELVVRADSTYRSVADTFGARIAFTVPESQSGYGAALAYFMDWDAQPPQGAQPPQDAQACLATRPPLFSEIVAPTITPLGALNAVIGGHAELAPIDSYALDLLRRFRPDLTSQVRSVARTAPTPIPVLVASPGDAGSRAATQALQAVFREAHLNASIKGLMDQLLLQRFARPEAAGYGVLRTRFEMASRYWTERPLAARTDSVFAL